MFKSKNDSSEGPPQQELIKLSDHYKNRRYDKAEKLAVLITQQFSEHQFSWKILGAIFRQTGRIAEALIANQTAVAINSQDAAAQSNLGVTLKNLGRLGEAEASYRKAIAVKSDYAAAHYNLAITLQALGRLEEAEASCRQAISLKPNYAEAHCKLGIMLKELGRLEEAEASYGQAITLKPQYTAAFMNRWKLLFDKGEFEAALKDADFCNTKISRMHSLETLYALGRIEEIYKRIEMQSEVDDKNIRVASFASFFAETEKKETAHNFCNKPMDFIHFSNVSSHLKNSNLFLTQLIDELYELTTIWEPSGKTTKKGFQTPPISEMNLFKNPPVKLQRLKSIIIDELDSYYSKFQNKACSYIQNWPSEKNLLGWQVILKQQGYQAAHIHPGGWLSGVIYLKVVPSLEKDEGAIEFSLNGDHFSNVNSPKLTYQPEVGDIVFFPSSLHHRTIPFTTDMDRVIISFDLIPEAITH